MKNDTIERVKTHVLNDFILHNSGVQLQIKEIELKTTVAVT